MTIAAAKVNAFLSFLSTYLPFLLHKLICSFYFKFSSDPPKMSANRVM